MCALLLATSSVNAANDKPLANDQRGHTERLPSHKHVM